MEQHKSDFGTRTNPINAIEIIRINPIAKRFEISDLIFAQFNCPEHDILSMWTQTDHLTHVLSGKSTWKTAAGILSAEAGESVFFKKGAYIMPQHFEEELCMQVFFIPDAFVRETVIELAEDLHALPESFDSNEQAIRVNNDVALTAFFQAMDIYFAGDEDPPEALLKLKLKELLTSILLGQNNRTLSAYFRSLVGRDGPAVAAIMETNFRHNLSMAAYAQMCNRSLSSFKREFRKHYGTSPGKWLLDRRLEHSVSLLQSTDMSVTEITLECGFVDLSHFSKAFKEKFGRSPSAYRTACVTTP